MIDPEEIKDQAGLIRQLDQLRRRAGLSYDALARAANVSSATLHDMIKGKSFPRQGTLLAVVKACGEASNRGQWVEAWIRADKARLRQSAFTELWRRLDGGPEAGRLTALADAGFSHPLAVTPPPWQGGRPSIRVAVLVGCDPLGPEPPAASRLRSRFREFLARPPVMHLVGDLTGAGALTWRSYGGDGPVSLQAVLTGDDLDAAPAAAALLNLPAAGVSRSGQCGEFVLYVEPRTARGTPAAAVNLAAWHRRLTWVLAVPAALAEFLARDAGLTTNDDPRTQAGLWLTAAGPGMTGLVDTDGLEAVPGSTPSSTFTGCVLADPAGKPAMTTARELLTTMCDLSLQLDEYEPLLEALLTRGRRAPQEWARRTFILMPPSPLPEELRRPEELLGPRADRAVGISLGTANSVVATLEGRRARGHPQWGGVPGHAVRRSVRQERRHARR